MTLSNRVKNLYLMHGSYQAVSDATGIDRDYLYSLATGEKKNTSDETILRLGLEKVVSYKLLDN